MFLQTDKVIKPQQIFKDVTNKMAPGIGQFFILHKSNYGDNE